ASVSSGRQPSGGRHDIRPRHLRLPPLPLVRRRPRGRRRPSPRQRSSWDSASRCGLSSTPASLQASCSADTASPCHASSRYISCSFPERRASEAGMDSGRVSPEFGFASRRPPPAHRRRRPAFLYVSGVRIWAWQLRLETSETRL
ncbi:hypothetical protein CSHISOI_07804, partial [Colletotrichum shisoi]